ncbi:protein kinase domain-containing protein [Helicobacter cetorum]|uniref:protein kinase domain-containing protein n=1 Tax=Helicobacter cetorum TaxID=138563 RepID=UPI000CF12568|nr:protein kinase [Helicobacter cetorum]
MDKIYIDCIDCFDGKHKIDDKPLGEGGQGVVYAIKESHPKFKLALKLKRNNGQIITDEEEIRAYFENLDNLIYKPNLKDLAVTLPLASLKQDKNCKVLDEKKQLQEIQDCGYIMEYLEGMIPLSALFPSEVSNEKGFDENLEIPPFLQVLFNKDKRSACYIAYYRSNGSLRKRLEVLANIASVLNDLHVRGLIYGDLSHNNVFIFQNKAGVKFIDADNIEYESSNTKSITTPDYEVPEINGNKEFNSIYSDLYAFSILCFYLLTMAHPFKGKGLEQESWDNEEIKNIWELAWIEDSKDSSNEAVGFGLRGDSTITKDLKALFMQTFEDGKLDKYQRPNLSSYMLALLNAKDDVLECLECGMGYYEKLFEECPYCDAKKPKHLLVSAFLQTPNKEMYLLRTYKESIKENEPIYLPNYLFRHLDSHDLNASFCAIKKDKNYEMIFLQEINSQEEVWLLEPYQEQVFNSKPYVLDIGSGIKVRVKGLSDILVEIKECNK